MRQKADDYAFAPCSVFRMMTALIPFISPAWELTKSLILWNFIPKLRFIPTRRNTMKKERILEELYNAVKEELKPSAEARQAESRFVEIREKFLKM